MTFQSHIAFAHDLCKKAIRPNSIVVDATCGNGFDAYFLATTAPYGHIYCFDIQKEAIEKTEKRLEPLSIQKTFYHGSHADIDKVLQEKKASCIMYNLGYLPGHDKSITTTTQTSIESIQKALFCLDAQGIISITCYPGHSEGKKETEVIIDFCQTLDPKKYKVTKIAEINRELRPILIAVQSL